VPLLEIVTEPDLRAPEEVDAFMTAMRQLARYLEISDGNMQEGSMRCDVNVSVRKMGSTALGERCEIKNMNSMRFARQAIAFETKRQIDILEKGGTIVRETMNFDPVTGETSPMRDKESAHDYRYFPDPDLPPVVLSEDWIAGVKASLPALPNELFEKFTGEFQLSDYDAGLLAAERETAMFFLRLVLSDLTNFQNLSNLKDGKFFKAAANLIINRINPWLSETGTALNDFPVPPERLIEFIQLIDEGKVSASIAYQRLFPVLVENPDTSPLELAQSLHLIHSAGTDFLEKLVEEVLAANPREVEAFQNGKKGLIGFFMGEVMKASRGKAEPKSTREMILKKLG
jgi:aspartyl-tRNA(Asn)/glutamyl-tRNA(Gln) amidotransferase subunit B